jgi:hypothetical protein
MTWVKPPDIARDGLFSMRKPISIAPYSRDTELTVIQFEVAFALAFPYRRVFGGWINAQSMEQVDVHATHWRPWGRPFGSGRSQRSCAGSSRGHRNMIPKSRDKPVGVTSCLG